MRQRVERDVEGHDIARGPESPGGSCGDESGARTDVEHAVARGDPGPVEDPVPHPLEEG